MKTTTPKNNEEIMSEKDTLKACPFCGVKAQLYQVDISYAVSCTSKQKGTSNCHGVNIPANGISYPPTSFRKPEIAIKAWNKRASNDE